MVHAIFQGLKVVELASVLAGPAVGMFFAELGAEVIKVENKRTGGDVTRQWKVPSETAGSAFSAYYGSINWGKRSVLMDLGEEDDYRQVIQWVQAADILISNLKPESAESLQVDYFRLKAFNPRLIYAQLTGYGEEDRLPAFDVVLQAEAGFLYMTGEPGREPVKMPVALIDILAAHQLKEGILLALIKRSATGEGSYVTTSLLESAIASLANQATNWLMAGHLPQPLGSLHPNIAPYGEIFYSLDGKPLVLAVGTEKQFQRLCEFLGLPELSQQESYRSNAQRLRNRKALQEELAPAFRQFSREDLLDGLHGLGIPVGSIRNMQEVFELPVAQNMILSGKLPDGTPVRCVKTVAFDVR